MVHTYYVLLFRLSAHSSPEKRNQTEKSEKCKLLSCTWEQKFWVFEINKSKLIFLVKGQSLHSNHVENSFSNTIWIPLTFLSKHEAGFLLQILNLTELSQLRRHCKCLVYNILLLKGKEFGELIIFLLSPLWFSFWQVSLLHTGADWSLTVWKWQVLVRPLWDLLQSAVISLSAHSIVNSLYLLVPQPFTSKQNWTCLI